MTKHVSVVHTAYYSLFISTPDDDKFTHQADDIEKKNSTPFQLIT